MALYNLAGFKTTTLGTADVVFNAPVTALNTFPLAGVPNGSTVTYMLENFDGAGSVDAREVGRGVWNSGTLTLARTTVVDSTNGGAKIVLGGTAEARITAIAQDFSAAAVGAPALVSPSVVGNFASFSNVSGGQADSGFSGASFQPIDATLTSIAALGTVADRMIYTTGVDTWAEATLTAFARTFLDDANAAAVLTTIGAQAALGYTPVDITSADYVDLTDGGATVLHTHAGGGVSGSGVVGQLAEWVTNTTTLQAAKIIGPATNILTITNAAASTLALAITSAKTLTLTATDNWNLTVPATGTAALLATANVFTTQQMVDGTSDQIQLRVQAHSTQTTNLQTWEISAGTPLVSVSGAGRLGISSAAATPAALLDISDFLSGHTTTPAAQIFRLSSYTGASTTYAITTTIQTPNGTNASSQYAGMKMVAQSGGSATSVQKMVGFEGRVLWQTTSGTLALAQGAMMTVSNTSTGIIAAVKSLAITSTINSGGGSITSVIGLDIEDQTVGTTSNYAIRTGAGLIVFNEGGDANTDMRVEGDTDANLLFTDASVDMVGIGTNAPSNKVHALLSSAATNAVTNIARLTHNSTGTAAAGLGGGLIFGLESTTTNDQDAGRLTYEWATATHASRKALSKWTVFDTAEREGVRIEASGTAAMLGFYGGAAVVRGAALTTQLTTITHTSPGTPDYAIQDLTNIAPYGFATQDEGNTVLSVVRNLQIRVAELEARLGSATGVNLFA